MKTFTFFYHYNKPISKQTGIPTLTLHFKNKCHFVQKIISKVETFTRKQNRQPHIVVKGKAKNISIDNGITLIK